ncbi:tetraspanin-17 [Chanos chanos]|uniref:Tetraspanin-17 n=1 Tax=Chanos chanos TaxID=29144 RepID=A0A6J2VTZ4_CHACN|nr:tetraspanin-17-like [Chanos chanos]
MAPVNIHLKRGFITTDIILGVVGTVILAFTLFSHGHVSREEEVQPYVPGVTILYIIGGITFLMSVFGLFGAMKEKPWALIVFSVGMILLILLLIVISGNAIYAKVKFPEQLFNDTVLSDQTPEFQNMVESWQTLFHCCGLNRGYQEWEGHIPHSCLCEQPEESLSPCIEVELLNGTTKTDIKVYKEPCLPHIISSMTLVFDVMLVILLGYAAFLIIATGMAIAIACQKRRTSITPPVKFSAESSNSKYTELSYNTDND